jgi:hypothetical protein
MASTINKIHYGAYKNGNVDPMLAGDAAPMLGQQIEPRSH